MTKALSSVSDYLAIFHRFVQPNALTGLNEVRQHIRTDGALSIHNASKQRTERAPANTTVANGVNYVVQTRTWDACPTAHFPRDTSDAESS